MFKILFPYLLIMAAFLLDTVVMPLISGFFLIPLLGLCFVAAFGYMRGGIRGIFYGILYGLLYDICCGPILGVMTLVAIGTGLACGIFERLKIKPKMKALLLFFACFLLYELAMCIYLTLYSYSFSGMMIARSLARVPVYTLLTAGIFRLFRSRYYLHGNERNPFAKGAK